MTNREYFEKNNVSFNEVLKEFNNMKFKSFDKFLNHEISVKFKAGDIIVTDCSKNRAKESHWNHNVVFRVKDHYCIDDSNSYRLEFLTPGDVLSIRAIIDLDVDFIDAVCELY